MLRGRPLRNFASCTAGAAPFPQPARGCPIFLAGINLNRRKRTRRESPQPLTMLTGRPTRPGKARRLPRTPAPNPAKRKRTHCRKFLVSLEARRRNPTRPSRSPISLSRRRETRHDSRTSGGSSQYSPSKSVDSRNRTNARRDAVDGHGAGYGARPSTASLRAFVLLRESTDLEGEYWLEPPLVRESWRVSLLRLRLIGLRLGLVGFLLLASKDTKNFLQWVLFLFAGLGAGVRGRRRALPGRVGRPVSIVSGCGLSLRVRLRRFRLIPAKNMGQPRAGCGNGAAPAVQLAKLRRGRPRNINFLPRCRAVRRGEFQRVGVDQNRLHTLGRGEIFHVAVSGERRGANHEVSPNGGGRGATRQSKIAVVVKADPNHGHEI